jgi:hypothetical protein
VTVVGSDLTSVLLPPQAAKFRHTIMITIRTQNLKDFIIKPPFPGNKVWAKTLMALISKFHIPHSYIIPPVAGIK